jgi:hypothetical protein
MIEMEIFVYGIIINLSTGCQTSRLPYFPDNLLTDGGEIFNLMRQPPYTARKIPGTHFCQRLSGPQSHSAAGGIR